MAASQRLRRLPWRAELVLALGAGAAAFALVALLLELAGPDVLVAVVGAACVVGVVAIERAWGIAYAVPAALAALVAFDWYQFPPTHPFAVPDAANLASLLVYLGAAALVGELAAHAARRAEMSEAARSRLAEDQAALRRVATLVARGVPPAEIVAAVAAEASALLGVDGARVVPYADDVDATPDAVLERTLAEPDVRAAVGAPVAVDGRPWGVLVAWSCDRSSLPSAARARLADFTELVATAISNTASREQLAKLAAEQAALRRVATLVAQGAAPSAVFAAVAHEVGELLEVDATHIGRYDPDGTTVGVGSWSRAGDHIAEGTRAPARGENVTARVRRTGRPARIDSYEDAADEPLDRLVRAAGIRSSVGAPITVEGEQWGVMVASSKRDLPLPRNSESRIAAFTELAATAIANTEARAGMRRLAEEQAALRRVATLVARECPPEEVFAAVTEEVGRLLAVAHTTMIRFEPDGTGVAVASAGPVPVGGERAAARVHRTGRAARSEDGGAVASPILVEERLWGAMLVTSDGDPLPPDTEDRIAEFTALVATAIANVEARAALAASRARIVAAADEERRQVVRDLHDGAQQRLVHAVVTLKHARRAMDEGNGSAAALIDDALGHAVAATEELRELAHGILPAALVRGGLRAGVDALASRMPVPVVTDVAAERFPAPVEATAYFVVAEALTNVAKHARARHAAVSARVEDGALRIDVRDDGVGGARADGSGLVGLADRLAVLDGGLRVESPADGGTLVAAAIPLGRRPQRQ